MHFFHFKRYLSEAGAILAGYDDATYSNVSIYLNDNKQISKVLVSFTESGTDILGSYTCECSYTFEISDINKVSFTLPTSYTEYSEEEGQDDPEETNLGTLESPLTVDEAIAIINEYEDNEESTELGYVTGVITKITHNSTHDTYTITLQATSGKFQVYSCKLNGFDAPVKGDTITVCGYFKKYVKSSSTTYEIAYSSTNTTNPILVAVSGQNKESLTLNYSSFTVDVGTTLQTALEDLVVTYTDGDGNQTVLTSDKYTLTDVNTFDGNTKGTYSFTITYNSLTATFQIRVKDNENDSFVDEDAETLEEACAKYDTTRGMASTGDVNVLVIPIAFTNQSYNANEVLAKLELGFNGTSDATGWESLKSYYYKSSYGKLNFNATITEIYNTGVSYNKSLEMESSGDSKDVEWMNAALTYFDSTYDYSKFDSNGDGNIDTIYVVYLAPYQNSSTTSEDCIWWAYTNNVYTQKTFDSKKTDYYMFFSYEFFNDDLNNKSIACNSETVIHETGHSMGLDDYYDYDDDKGPDGGIGGGDMMDWNVGDHNAYSKAILGWIDPTIAGENDLTITLNSFGATGDSLIVAKDWNGTYFDEYYIIDFYTPDGLNAFCAGSSGLFSTSGIRIYHIMAEINATQCKEYGQAYYMTNYDNSYTTYKLISLVEADGNNSIEKGGESSNSDIFQQGKSTSLKWYGASKAAFTITVDSITSSNATVTVSFN